jgi:hypothetical protein
VLGLGLGLELENIVVKTSIAQKENPRFFTLFFFFFFRSNSTLRPSFCYIFENRTFQTKDRKGIVWHCLLVLSPSLSCARLAFYCLVFILSCLSCLVSCLGFVSSLSPSRRVSVFGLVFGRLVSSLFLSSRRVTSCRVLCCTRLCLVSFEKGCIVPSGVVTRDPLRVGHYPYPFTRSSDEGA